jgi:hypothetical protein
MSAVPLRRINPKRVRYIKLGGGGSWEQECLDRGIIRIGFGTGRPEGFSLCQSGHWKDVIESFRAGGKTAGLAKRFTNELRLFFEDDGTTLWINFMIGRLHWGMLDHRSAEQHPDGGGALRHVQDGWCDKDLDGNTLSKDRLSGALTKLAAYQGTSCDVDVSSYVIRRITA